MIRLDPNVRPIAVALIAGMALVFLAQIATGFLAALPIPPSLRASLEDWEGLWSLLYSLFMIQIPIALLGAVVAWGMFRWLDRSTWPVVLACVAPWFAFAAVDLLDDYERYYASPSRNGLSGLEALFAILCLPAGVWLASRQHRGRRAA